MKRGRSSRAVAPRRVCLLAYDGANGLDVVGPLEVFATASRYRAVDDPKAPPPYAIEILAAKRGPVRMHSGITVCADRAYRRGAWWRGHIARRGRRGARARCRCRACGRWLQAHRAARAAPRPRFVPAPSSSPRRGCSTAVARRRTGARADAAGAPLVPERPRSRRTLIFVRDGSIYTSAGVTAGMDLALALVEADLGGKRWRWRWRRGLVRLPEASGRPVAVQQPSRRAGRLRAARCGDLPDWILEHLDERSDRRAPGGARRHEPAQLRARLPAARPA